MLRMIVPVFVMMILISACVTQKAEQRADPLASASSSQKSDGQNPDGFICEMEPSTGSHIPEKVCRYAPDTAQQRHVTQDAMRALRNTQRTSD